MPKAPAMQKQVDTWSEVVARNADLRGADRAVTLLRDGEEPSCMTFAEVDLAARAVASRLLSLAANSEPVLILCEPGLDYQKALWGTIYAGAIAVPAYPPDPTRLKRTLPRLSALVADSRATTVLTTSTILGMASAVSALAPELGRLRWLAIDQIPNEEACEFRPPAQQGDDIALLQYTSGSTQLPRGVVLTHAHLLANCKALFEVCRAAAPLSMASWLPPYHDMGLISGLLLPMFAAASTVLMSPLEFMRRPAVWLEAISRYGVSLSGGPNFAYDLAVRKTTPEQREQLDLSSWRVAFTGAEPIRADTLRRFASAFASAKFSPKALCPCYGLAEATLIVSGAVSTDGARIERVSRSALAQGAGQPPSHDGDATDLVGCGPCIPEHELEIVDRASQRKLPPGQVGEVWVTGPSVALGYWQRPEETAEVFEGRLPGSEARYLRTGDLGFLMAGQLFITGREKDLIIVAGRNLYPQDIERTVEQAHSSVKGGGCAAFSVEAAGAERVVIVAEVDARMAQSLDTVLEHIRDAVRVQHEVEPLRVVLLRPGSIAKTSSGKIQRSTCRAELLAGSLEAIADSTSDSAGRTRPGLTAVQSS